MPVKLSRRKISSYMADCFVAGNDSELLVKQLAAYLIDNDQTKELELVIRDIEYELQMRGTVIARVTTRFDLTDATRREIEKMIHNQMNSKQIIFNEIIDPKIIAGIKIDLPGKQLDATIARRLTKLRTNYNK